MVYYLKLWLHIDNSTDEECEYATSCFLHKGIQRYLKVLSNGAEQMHSVQKDARSESLLTLSKSISDWKMTKFTIKKNKGYSMGQ